MFFDEIQVCFETYILYILYILSRQEAAAKSTVVI